jgi:hypothetical protein
MWQAVRSLAVVTVLCAAALPTVRAAEDKPQIPGGIEGKVKSVDVEKDAITIVTDKGTQRTFSVSKDTTMVGPRGGKVRRRLRDPRFQDGMPVTIVAEGKAATEIHLGYDREPGESGAASTKAPASAETPAPTPATRMPSAARVTKEAAEPPAERVTAKKVDVTAAKPKAEADEDNEFPGKVKRFDPDRRMLVIKMVNGKDRAFILSKDVEVLVKGTKSKRGLEDPALKTGVAVEVVTDEGGRKVQEVRIVPAKR